MLAGKRREPLLDGVAHGVGPAGEEQEIPAGRKVSAQPGHRRARVRCQRGVDELEIVQPAFDEKRERERGQDGCSRAREPVCRAANFSEQGGERVEESQRGQHGQGDMRDGDRRARVHEQGEENKGGQQELTFPDGIDKTREAQEQEKRNDLVADEKANQQGAPGGG